MGSGHLHVAGTKSGCNFYSGGDWHVKDGDDIFTSLTDTSEQSGTLRGDFLYTPTSRHQALFTHGNGERPGSLSELNSKSSPQPLQ